MANKKGISLIVLVITILVMIILAGAVVLTLSSTGIIDKSSEATKASDKANLKALVDVAWADAYASGARKSTEIKAIMQERLRDTDMAGYSIKVTPNGATVEDVEENGRSSGMYVVEAEMNEYGFYYDYAYSINLGMLALSGNSSIPLTKVGFVPREDGTADAIVSLPVIMGNRPVLIDFMALIDMLAKLEGTDVPDIKLKYVEGGAYIVVKIKNDDGTEEVQELGPIPFSDDGMGIPIGAVAGTNEISADLGLSCDFNTIHEIYRDKVYMGVLETEDGFVQVKATYGSDDTFTVYDSLTQTTRKVKATVILGCMLSTDIQYTGTSVSGKSIGIVSADGEYIMLTPTQEGEFSDLPPATLRLVNN